MIGSMTGNKSKLAATVDQQIKTGHIIERMAGSQALKIILEKVNTQKISNTHTDTQTQNRNICFDPP